MLLREIEGHLWGVYKAQGHCCEGCRERDELSVGQESRRRLEGDKDERS